MEVNGTRKLVYTPENYLVTSNNGNCQFTIEPQDNPIPFINLGVGMLRAYYMVFNLGNNSIGLTGSRKVDPLKYYFKNERKTVRIGKNTYDLNNLIAGVCTVIGVILVVWIFLIIFCKKKQ